MNGAADRVQLGKTGIETSAVGIGAWSWGDKWVWNYGKGYTENDVREAYSATIASGIDLIDTAEMYGQGESERLLGGFLRVGGARPVVATKFAPLPWRLSRSRLIAALRRSLQRLGLGQVDLYQVHFPLPLLSVVTWAEGLADAVEQGLTRAVGVSNYSADQMRRAHEVLAKRGIPLASNQVEYSLLARNPERNGVLEACRDLGISLIAYSPLGMGMLTGKYVQGNAPAGMRGRRYGKHLAEIQTLNGLLKEIGQAHGGKTPGQVAINWTMSKGALPIPGAKNARQAAENAGAMGWRLAADEVGALDAASERVSVR
jgi:aryl-alcohol dehydrogenase-like predicted oxidoreductase